MFRYDKVKVVKGGKTMKALVLCGGIPQVELIKQLKERGIYTILADMNENVVARKYADKFYPVSVLDIKAVKELALLENVDMIITVCADQVLLVCAQISEMLGLPSYISYETAKKVSDKEFMKKIFSENDIPSSKYVVMENLDMNRISTMKYPLIVKPVDSYSSKGVKKVFHVSEVQEAFDAALNISRSKKVIIEEYVQGTELSIDAYIEDGVAHILCISQLDKIPANNKFVINRLTYPADISEKIEKEIRNIVKKIADAFGLVNTPMLVQLIYNEDNISVLEFCARTGGGDKFRLIKNVANFDVVKAVIDLTLGEKPHVNLKEKNEKYIINEFLYCKPAEFDHLEGFESLCSENIISEYFQLKRKGASIGEVKSSSDRVAYFTVEDTNRERVMYKHRLAVERIKVIDKNGDNVLRKDLIKNFRIDYR